MGQALSYVNFLTLRGWVVLVGAVILMTIGYNDPYKGELLALGVFLVGAIVVGVIMMVILRAIIEWKRGQIMWGIEKMVVVADSQLSLGAVYLPVVWRLVGLLPVQMEINTETVLGERVVWEGQPRRDQIPALPKHKLQRGEYTLGPLKVVVMDMLGLTKMEVLSRQKQNLRVWPKVRRIKEITSIFWRRDPRGKLVAKHIIRDEDFADLRLYKPGDDVRHINWKVSAKLDELVTRHPELTIMTITAELVIGVDNTFSYSHTPALAKKVLDRQVEEVAALAAAYLEYRGKLKLVFMGGEGGWGRWKGVEIKTLEQGLNVLAGVAPVMGVWGDEDLESIVGKQAVIWIRHSLAETERVRKWQVEGWLLRSMVVVTSDFVQVKMKKKAFSWESFLLSREYMSPPKPKKRQGLEAEEKIYKDLLEEEKKRRLPFDTIYEK